MKEWMNGLKQEIYLLSVSMAQKKSPKGHIRQQMAKFQFKKKGSYERNQQSYFGRKFGQRSRDTTNAIRWISHEHIHSHIKNVEGQDERGEKGTDAMAQGNAIQ